MRPTRVLTWHVHGNYLLYLSQADAEFYLPVRADGPPGYGGRGSTFPFPGRVKDVPAEAVRDLQFDCVLYQTRANFEVDGPAILSEAQRRLPRIYLEHDPPWQEPTDTLHWSDDPGGLLVHVTPFNALMWDAGRTPSRVIEHGVFLPGEPCYSGEIDRGIVVVNHLARRGRKLGADLFEMLRRDVPLDLVGMDAESLGGLGEVAPPELAATLARYRFFFHPARYTSLGLAVIEAMMVGLPVVGLATTELVTVIRDGASGFLATDPSRLVGPMRDLLADRGLAGRLGEEARRVARDRFDIRRFARDWDTTFATVAGRSGSERPWPIQAVTSAD